MHVLVLNKENVISIHNFHSLLI